MAEDVPKLEKLLKKGKNVTPQVIADRQVKVGSYLDNQAWHAAHWRCLDEQPRWQHWLQSCLGDHHCHAQQQVRSSLHAVLVVSCWRLSIAISGMC